MRPKLKVEAVENQGVPEESVSPGAEAEAEFAPGAVLSVAPSPAPGTLVGECIDPQHPTLQGRARIRWTASDGSLCERWIPMLMTVTVRPQDRVLMSQPLNWGEPVILGVLDGFAERPLRPPVGGPVLELQNDEAVRIRSRDGHELLEVSLSEGEPVVRLLSAAVGLNLPGRLSISAESIDLRARKGEVVVSATDDVVVTGATVKLN